MIGQFTVSIDSDGNSTYHGLSPHMYTSVGMIARDLTGAADSLAAFVESPGDTAILITPGTNVDNARHVAVIADTDMLSPEQAYARVREAARQLAGRLLFKRVGSTLRGCIGPEIRAVIDETGARAIICPAVPREGRTVAGGVGRLNSVPLHLTEYGRDPTSPCLESSLPVVLRDAGVDAAAIPLEVVRRGGTALHQALLATTSSAVVVDAETDEDMRSIAVALAALGTGWCACAASGLSPHLAQALGGRGETRWCEQSRRGDHRVLAVIGTTNPISAAQVTRVDGADNVATIRIEARTLCAGTRDVDHWEEQALSALGRGASAVLTTSLSDVVPHLSDMVAPHLGALAARTVLGGAASELVLSGGRTALHTCRALGIPSVQVLGELEPGVVCCRGMDLNGVERTVVTKAGGFGDPGTLARLLGLKPSRTTDA